MSLLGGAKPGPIVVSALVVLGFIAVVVLLLLKPMAITGELADVLKILLGTLSAQFGAVVQYHIGSSAGSKSKDDIIGGLVSGRQGASPPPAGPGAGG